MKKALRMGSSYLGLNLNGELSSKGSVNVLGTGTDSPDHRDDLLEVSLLFTFTVKAHEDDLDLSSCDVDVEYRPQRPSDREQLLLALGSHVEREVDDLVVHGVLHGRR